MGLFDSFILFIISKNKVFLRNLLSFFCVLSGTNMSDGLCRGILQHISTGNEAARKNVQGIFATSLPDYADQSTSSGFPFQMLNNVRRVAPPFLRQQHQQQQQPQSTGFFSRIKNFFTGSSNANVPPPQPQIQQQMAFQPQQQQQQQLPPPIDMLTNAFDPSMQQQQAILPDVIQQQQQVIMPQMQMQIPIQQQQITPETIPATEEEEKEKEVKTEEKEKEKEKKIEITPEDNDHIHTIFLLTDGYANEGVSEPTAFTQATQNAMRLLNEIKKCTLFCFGVGSSHNEQLMRQLVEVGNGMYYFIF